MPKARLGKRTADAAQPGAKTYVLYDEDLAGFGLRIQPTGRKTWICEYRPVGGGRRAATRRMKIASAGELTADEARRRAKDILAEVRLGGDPAVRRATARAMPTVAELTERFIEEGCIPPRIGPRTAKLYADNLRRVAGPHIGRIKIDALTSADVTRMHRRVGAEHPTTANNTLTALASLCKFASAEGLLPKGTNPVSGVEKFKAQPKERFLSTAEFIRLGDAIREAETTGLPWAVNDLADPAKARHRAKAEIAVVILPPHVAAALRLLLFTGCRKGEILTLRWSEVDFERGTLFLAKTKTGRRAVILNAPALSILSALPRMSEYVFPGASPGEPRSDITGHWYRIRKRAGLDGADGSEPVRLHDLRHTFASFGVAGGMGLPIVGKLLGHTQSATTARYAHLDSDPLREATERIGRGIAAALGEAGQARGSR